jgi:hypothetical protein
MALIADDFVLYKDGNNIMSGGYSINSIFLKNGVSPMQTVNFRKKGLETNSLESSDSKKEKDSKEKDGKNEKPHSSSISSLFEDLVIPAGLYFNNTKLFPENKIPFEEYKEHTMLPDDIFDKLFKMVEYEPNLKANNKKKTRKGLRGTGTSGTGTSGTGTSKKGFTKKAKKD